MDSTGLEPEVIRALECVSKEKNFLLEGGAGSGKTYSLISLINEITKKYPRKSIVCITYTNNAVEEIKSRISNEDVIVSTIHEFIWQLIKRYQSEIKECLLECIQSEEETYKNFKDVDNIVNQAYLEDVTVTYKEYYSMDKKGIDEIAISHDHLLLLAEKMFSKYKKLSDIFKDRANIIFIDEYQDTSPEIVKILLEHIKKSSKSCCVGFFGDSMQAIYDSGVGKLPENYDYERIEKEQNRRNPKTVIDLANKIRTDSLKQKESNDSNAPNMANGQIIEGKVTFIYGSEEEQLPNFQMIDCFKDWNFNEGGNVKELYLTHKYNAKRAGFEELMSIYNGNLIFKILKKIKNSKKVPVTEGFTVKELVEQNSFKTKDIDENERYKNIYEEIKERNFDEVYAKYSIKEESLLAYKYNDKTGCYVADSNRDRILRTLDLINSLLELYNEGNHHQFLKRTNYCIKSLENKKELANVMDSLNDDEKTIGDIIEIALTNKVIHADELFEEYTENKGYYLWQEIKQIPIKEYRNSIAYLKQYSPVATQHSVKGSEYDNVLVILKSNWNKYNFKTLFGQGSSKESVINRTRNLFYVSVTRAKKELVVYMPTEDAKIIAEAKKLFGPKNVHDID